MRNKDREPEVRELLDAQGANTSELSFAQADLTSDAGWAQAVEGCDYVLHVASPFPVGQPKDENEVVRPAVDGTLRVLRAARTAKVRRVVLTSSFAAVGYGKPNQTEPFDETSWTSLDSPDVQPYIKSKTLAEKAAWEYIGAEGGPMELSVVNPVGIFGPVLGPDLSGSIALVKRMLDGGMSACPKVYFGVVDVRDAADLHLRAMTHPAARNERFLAVAGPSVSLLDVAQILRKGLGERASKVPKREIASWILRLTAYVKPEARAVLPQLGKRRSSTSEKARRLLNWSARSTEEAILATGRSLLEQGLNAS